MVGKLLLVGITFLGEDQDGVEQFLTYGRITSVDASHGIAIEKAGGTGYFTIPCDLSNIFPAPPGEYRCGGDVVADPDFTTCWTIEAGGDGIDVDEIKRSGFGGFILRAC